MNASTLDPCPLNELGKGIFPPELEERLLADGVVFARRLPSTSRRVPYDIVSSKRPMLEAMADAFLDAGRSRRAIEARECVTV